MTPARCRWLYAHAGGVDRGRERAPRPTATSSTLAIRGARRARRAGSCLAPRGARAATTARTPVPVRFERDATGIVVRPIPDTDVGRRFPDGLLPHRSRRRARRSSASAGDEAALRRRPLARRSRSRGRRSAARRARRISRITGRLVADAPRRAGKLGRRGAARDAFWATWRRRRRPRRRRAPRTIARVAGHPAVVRARRARSTTSRRAASSSTPAAAGARATSARAPSSCCSRSAAGAACATCCCASSRNQNPDGDWPQWFMFFERERGIRAGDSHGDIVFWPLLALAPVPRSPSDDASILDVVVPFFASATATTRAERGDDRCARRARARGHRRRVDPGHVARRVRPRRLERLAAARRPGDARAPLQQLDGDAAPSDARTRWRAALAPPRPATRRDRARRASPPRIRAGLRSGCSSRTARSPASRTSTPTDGRLPRSIRAIGRPASTTGCCR